MKKTLLLIFIGCGFSFAQDIQEYVVEQDSIKKNFRYALYWIDFSVPEEADFLGIYGSPFLDSRWREGTASLEGKWSITAPMRFNAEREVIEYLDTDNRRKDFKREPRIKVEIDNKPYEVLTTIDEGKEKATYFNPLMKAGTVKLYFRPKKKLVNIRETTHGVGNCWLQCVNASSHYLVWSDGIPQKIKLNRKSLLNALSDQREALEKYIDGYKLNLRKEADVIRLLKFYNALSYYGIPSIEQARL
ncbi:hypothetical protein [Poritiphilus flavus]|uniref:Uncharacterized protein n=1 Tax=Poritiphilus flavus TaxID=2697053 RepID=A0A6L9EG12_9FLAO|nr:hypothetical protein [Poritiphilus flavus]NAS13552.1 hypothetical protein [Poritiphilus flavus]